VGGKKGVVAGSESSAWNVSYNGIRYNAPLHYAEQVKHVGAEGF
jgi:hypothetical protein